MQTKSRTVVLRAVLLFVMGGWLPMAEAQCALCRMALESSAEGQAMAAGFNQAILFLLAAPFVVVGSGVLILWRAARPSPSQFAVSRGQIANKS